jgi:dTDP-4-amino-4,6-dideoxygalactose transaminase
MLRIGKPEADAVAKVLLSGKLFRYGALGSQCTRFERRYAKLLGVKHVWMTSSGTTAMTAALAALGIGPGDEVAVPACTYMATAVGVIAAGAIPIIVDVDESITMDPKALAAAVGPRTRAVVPVHMWGLPCDMNAIMRVARRHKQAVGGAYEGRMLGAIGDAGAFSFNYYKNMTCGEGGAVATNDDQAAQRAACMIDCCRFYWDGRGDGFRPFISNGSRASEIEGAIINVQLDRLKGMIQATRRQKKRVLAETAHSGLTPIRANSPKYECGTQVMYTLATTEAADEFARLTGGTVAGKTGRHVYTEWDQIFDHQGAHHPGLDPFRMPANRGCRMKYTKDMCSRSLGILNRTVMLGTHPDRKASDVTALIRKINAAAKAVGVGK